MIYYLEPDDLQKVLDLQNRIYAFLKEQSNPRFIVPRTEAYFTEHLDSPHKIAALQSDDGQHVAQAIFHAPHDFDVAELGVPTLPEGFEHGLRASVLQGMLIDPAMRGQGLMSRFIEQWQVWCKGQNISHLAARTEASHGASQHNFKKHGFTLIDTMIDPRDNAKICVFHKKISA